MVYGLQGMLAFQTAAARDSVKSDLENQVGSKQKYGVTEIVASPNRLGEFGLHASVRLVTKQDQEQLLGRIQSFLVGPLLPLPGSSVTVHDCPHDEATNDCAATVARTDW